MMPRLLAVILAVAGGASCKATSPTAPSPTTAGLVLLFPQSTRTDSSFGMLAYAFDTDGAYRNVTSQAQWSTSNPAIVTVNPGSFNSGRLLSPVSLGSAAVLVTFEGRSVQLPILVASRVLTPLRLDLTSTLMMRIGETSSIRAMYSGGLPSSNVSDIAVWTSSDSSVASVERGRITAHAVGTTEIRVSYQGLTDFYMMSVGPDDRSR